jgi:hypothetical protein
VAWVSTWKHFPTTPQKWSKRYLRRRYYEIVDQSVALTFDKTMMVPEPEVDMNPVKSSGTREKKVRKVEEEKLTWKMMKFTDGMTGPLTRRKMTEEEKWWWDKARELQEKK